MNRTTHIINSVNSRIAQIDGFNVLRVWDINKFSEYEFPYAHVRITGESADVTNEYENGSGSNETTTPRIEIVVGYSIERDTENEGLFAIEEAERIHQLRQWIDNAGYLVDDYGDILEQVYFDRMKYVGYNGITQDGTETKGVSVLGFTLDFQTVKRG